MMRMFLLALCCMFIQARLPQSGLYEVRKSRIEFHSNAALELIKAESDQLKGLVDIGKKQFAFKVPMSSFRGFNSALQQEHFNENYIESAKYPDASFSGKIIEDENLSRDGSYTLRAKGQLTIHGVSQERIIKSTVIVSQGKVRINSAFTILLSDHNIKIPRIVAEKLSSEINVQIQAELEAK